MNSSSQQGEEAQELAYLQKRMQLAKQENELLRKENQLQRKELTTLKATFTDVITDKRLKTAGPNGKAPTIHERFQNENSLRQVLDMQRQRIDQVEKEAQEYKQKYEKLLLGNGQPYSQTQVQVHEEKEVYDLRKKNAELESQIKEMIVAQAKELAQYRQKIATQDAQLILGTSQQSMRSTPQQISKQPSLEQSKLEPLEKNDKQQYQVLKVQMKRYF